MSALFTPELILVIFGLALLLLDAFAPRIPKRHLGFLGVIGITWAFVIISGQMNSGAAEPHPFWIPFAFNAWYILAAKMIILLAAFLTLLLLSETQLLTSRMVTGDSKNQDGTGELYILPLFATAGMMWMCSATNFISLFVALELTTLTFYVMVGFLRRNIGSLEGGVKYLVTGALSAAVLVMGIAWYYGCTGTFSLNGLSMTPHIPAGLFALALILLGLIYKIGAVPMHVWVPDVYQGAPTPITAFLSVASKTAGVCVIFTFAYRLNAEIREVYLIPVLTLIAIATAVIGNLGAIPQSNVKRMLGYSSIAHAGFIIPFFMFHSGTLQEIYPWPIIYLSCYLPMTFGAFYVLSLIRTQTGREDLEGFRGLGKRNPRLAAVTTLMFASLAGVPLTGGFYAKFLSFQAMVNGQMWTLLGVSVVAAAAGFYYYFKPIRAMYWEKADDDTPAIRVPLLSLVVLLMMSLTIILLGVAPFLKW